MEVIKLIDYAGWEAGIFKEEILRPVVERAIENNTKFCIDFEGSGEIPLLWICDTFPNFEDMDALKVISAMELNSNIFDGRNEDEVVEFFINHGKKNPPIKTASEEALGMINERNERLSKENRKLRAEKKKLEAEVKFLKGENLKQYRAMNKTQF